MIGDDIFKTIKAVAWELYEIKSLNEHAEEKTVIRAMQDCLEDEAKQQKAMDGKDWALIFTPTQLQTFIKAIMMEEGECDEVLFPRLWSPEKIGALLTKMSVHRQRTGKARKYLISNFEIKELAARYRLDLSDTSDGSDGKKEGVPPTRDPSLDGYSHDDGPEQDTPPKKPSQPSLSSPNTGEPHAPEDRKEFEVCANCGHWQGAPKVNESAFCAEHHKSSSKGSTCDKWQPRIEEAL